MAICKVYRAKKQPKSWDRFRPEWIEGMWIGWCYECKRSPARYWNFGATLGATLYHITIHHRKI